MLRANFCEWPTLALILATSATWMLLIGLYGELGPWVVCPLAVLTVTLQSSLQHEVLHGHPTRNPAVNEALVYCSLGLWIPYRRFKSLHLRHHNNDRLTDPYDDPESFYLAWRDWQSLPRPIKFVLTLNNSLLGRLLIGPAVSMVGFLGAEIRMMLAGDRVVMRAWLHHIAGAVPVVLFVTLVGGMPLWFYLLTVAYPAMSLLMLRTFAEHRAHENAEARSIIVEFCPLFSLLFLNNNLHVVHHANPRTAWYKLPGIYRSNRDDWQKRNEGYVFASYFALATRYFFKVKEPVAHPLRHTPAQAGNVPERVAS
ncbi:fatty acid desaturase [Labrenzia sp. VG12]|uniref:fatty acid desaturase n=1 Tax=Labrenzia sp. VG12 TaxID=2021862 RepID=UPI000B8C37C4|nr:fatty acid desaturase [Labrenzia sp. VG12]ASP36893.1 fatty acid desaturase [Labrenzia sp. VG12]